ncbi:hypothetical protein SCH01S_42_01190 [Sphingomonas changbaiensis NBRC 104936]|uniref:DUF1491 domain-containing protein n=1 Tax=Sphingomonas changbaiensis NBRC 104936 TaxID=1219043 RepID=A0A0E9MRM1_9SPHN|nr:DUF1491 family protein [Sphingomonas changbaiensis]GAO40076.1 hypothetical protein SCH01S_42_01190 [Sphingomonas changbaiensis NBRC 104936]
MTPRLTSRMTIDALMRRVQAAGGFATVLAKGDETAGAILLLCSERGEPQVLLERTIDLDGHYRWTPCGPQDVESDGSRDSYMRRRRDSDPDLWLIELDVADAERFAAETTGFD